MTPNQKLLLGVVAGITGYYLWNLRERRIAEMQSNATGPQKKVGLTMTDPKGNTKPGYSYNKSKNAWERLPKPKQMPDYQGECFCNGAWGTGCCTK